MKFQFQRRGTDMEKQSVEKKSEATAPSISYSTLYRFSTKCDKCMIVISLVGSLLAGLTLPYAIILVADVFHTMITHEKSKLQEKQNDAEFLQSIHKFGVNYSCVGFVLFVCIYFGNTFMNLTAINQIFKLRQEYLKVALNQDFSYFDLHQTSDFASKMADDVIKLEEGIGGKVSTFVYNVTTAIGCIFMALLKGWKLALLCLTTAPVTFLLVGLTGRIANNLYKQEAQHNGHASAVAQEVLSSVRTVYSYNGQRREVERYMQPLDEAKKIYIKKEFFTGLSMGCLFFCVFCSYALSFYLGIYLVVNDPEHYNADVMFSVFFGVMTALANLGMAGSLVPSFGLARGAGAQIFKLLDNVPSINPLLDRGLKPNTAEGLIEFKNVEFQYPSRPDVPVLKGISLSIKLGKTVAIVGHSGSGKSTIIQLISRYYDVCSGSVCLDGTDVRELSVVWLRSQIGVVSQEPVLFNTTVRENIRYGKQDATPVDIEAAALQADAHHFIMKLPKGYDTLVGQQGASLSGGQKQRIAIARALVRRPRLLLLDEATSALDTTCEAIVQRALDKASKGRTTVVVAHRLSTIRNASIIYVMKNGEIVEVGTHDELMGKPGHYADMVGLQAQDVISDDKVPSQTYWSEADKKEDVIETKVLYESKSSEIPRVSFWHMLAMKSKEWKWMVAGCFCAVLLGFAMPLFIVVFGDLFGTMSHPDVNILMEKVNKVSLVCVLLGIMMGAAHLVEAVSFGVSGALLSKNLRLRMFTHLLQQQVSFFDEKGNSTGALCAKLSAEPSYVQSATGSRIGVCLQGLGSIGLTMVIIVFYESRIGLVALAFLPMLIFVIYCQSKATTKESFGNMKALENSTKIALEAVCNIRTVVSLGLERWFVAEYSRALAAALEAARTNAHCRGLVAALSRSMFNFINAAALTYGGHLIVSEGIRCENILVTTQSIQMASGQAQNAFTIVPELQKGVASASRIAALLNTRPDINDPEAPAVSPFISSGSASLHDVEFTYPSRPGIRVLRGMNLQVESGKTIALVGRSGCGKSTVIQLLQRFYDPDAGKVCLDGIPLPTILTSEVRSAFGLVSQEPVLFDYSIEENIAYGDYARAPSHQQIIDAAKQASIHDFIISLPMGYKTNIGPKGMQLSGGQKQRVAIARALIRQPKILLLDEATSALDTESEKEVQAALESARASRTCVMIAHRLSTVRDVDLLCVVSEGRVAEAGTHQQLMDNKEIYYRLHTAS